jgi:hypothetical protein
MKGVPHLAVVHYEKVLEMVQKRMDAEEHEDVKEVSYERQTELMSRIFAVLPLRVVLLII